MFIEAYFFSKDDVEKFKQKDMLAEILKEMTGDYPALTKVFVTERDMYMANVLQKAAKPIPVVDENGGEWFTPVVLSGGSSSQEILNMLFHKFLSS